MSGEKNIYRRPLSLKKVYTHYCPGCGHSIVHKIMCELFDEMGIRGITIGVPPAGCAVLAYFYLDIDMQEAPHGRGPALATGIKRMLPDRIVFSYQGDGDLAAIGTAESFHAASRGENITIIFINNSVYGMTGGQMAPTTMLGQKTTTSPLGRNPQSEGYPTKISEALALMPGSAYIERCLVTSPASILRTKRAIRKAFEYQREGLGFTMVEVLSPCPTNWKLTPLDSLKFVEEKMATNFPPGVLKDIKASAKGSSGSNEQ